MTLYNYKIIHTASYIEIYKYERPIYRDNSKKQQQIDNAECNLSNENDAVKESDEEKELTQFKRLIKTRKNAKAELVRLIDTNYDNRTSFITLTTKENVTEREEFKNNFHKFITRLNYTFLKTKKRKLKYIAVLEKQERGAYHAHMIIFDIGFLPHDRLSKTWGHGFVKINKLTNIDSVTNVGRYVSKYMEKAIGQELLENKHKKSYFSSNNLKKPQVTKLYYENDELQTLIDNSEIQYESEYSTKYYDNDSFIDSTVKYIKIKRG